MWQLLSGRRPSHCPWALAPAATARDTTSTCILSFELPTCTPLSRESSYFCTVGWGPCTSTAGKPLGKPANSQFSATISVYPSGAEASGSLPWHPETASGYWSRYILQHEGGAGRKCNNSLPTCKIFLNLLGVSVSVGMPFILPGPLYP